MAKLWKGVKSPICCGVATSLYWTIACIYLLGFSLLCCGVPALLRGRKRFPSKAWGPYYSDTDPSYKGYDPALSQIPGVQVQPMQVDMGDAQIALGDDMTPRFPIAGGDPSEGDQFPGDQEHGGFTAAYDEGHEVADGSGSVFPPEHNPYAFADPATIPPAIQQRMSRSGRSAGSGTPGHLTPGTVELSHLPQNASAYHGAGGSRVMHYSGGADPGPGFAVDVQGPASDHSTSPASAPDSAGEIASPSLYPAMQPQPSPPSASASPQPPVHGQPLPPGWHNE